MSTSSQPSSQPKLIARARADAPDEPNPGRNGQHVADPAVVSVLAERRGRGRKRKFVWAFALVVLAALVALVVVQVRAAASAPAFEFGEVRRGDLRLVVTATGTLEASKTVEIGAEVTGNVVSVSVDYNDVVKKGQELATIDPEQLVASTEQSRAEVSATRAAVLEAKASAEETRLAALRAQEQAKRGLISSQQLEAAEAAAARAKAALASAEARLVLSRASLGLASSRLEKTKIVSPIDGIVLSRAVEPGQTVTAGFQTPILFKLAADLGELRLAVAVDEADIGRVRDGMQATFNVDAYPEREFASRVVSVRNEPKVSNNVVTYQAVLAIDNRERLLRPGMTATAGIVSQTLSNVVLVPSEAFRFTPPGPAGEALPPPPTKALERRVFVLEEGVPKPITVRIGPSDGSLTVIESNNLKPGTQVILDVLEGP